MDRKSILIIIFILILTSVLFACSGSDDEENALLGQLTALAQTATAGARDTGTGSADCPGRSNCDRQRSPG